MRLLRTAALLTFICLGTLVAACGGAVPGPSVSTSSSAASLRFVGPIRAIYTPYLPGEPGELRVGFRLNERAAEKSNGDARIKAVVAGERPEFVSRIARKRNHCYLAGPVDLPEDQGVRGHRIALTIYAAGQQIQAGAVVRVSATPGALSPRPRLCSGPKER